MNYHRLVVVMATFWLLPAGTTVAYEDAKETPVALGDLTGISKDQLERALQELKSSNGADEKCYMSYDRVNSTMIRPKDSLSKGAEFLGVSNSNTEAMSVYEDSVQGCMKVGGGA